MKTPQSHAQIFHRPPCAFLPGGLEKTAFSAHHPTSRDPVSRGAHLCKIPRCSLRGCDHHSRRQALCEMTPPKKKKGRLSRPPRRCYLHSKWPPCFRALLFLDPPWQEIRKNPTLPCLAELQARPFCHVNLADLRIQRPEVVEISKPEQTGRAKIKQAGQPLAEIKAMDTEET